MMELKLFLWEDVLCDYTCGVCFALAENVDEARKLIIESEENKYIVDLLEDEISEEPKIIDGKFGFSLWGCG